MVILAAGMGSRYGGLKQLDRFGPNGETLMEYSIYDAVKAGFDKIVFVIRPDFEEEFREHFLKRIDSVVKTDYVFQELHHLPKGFSVPAGRKKPWGTAHAVMRAQSVMHNPFAVLNADDFYGRDAIRGIFEYLNQENVQNSAKYGIVGYSLAKTLSEHGSVSRAVLGVDAKNNLTSIVERTKIFRKEDGQIVYEEDGVHFPLRGNESVSMNLMGFSPVIFNQMEEYFIEFLQNSILEPKAEFFLPLVLNKLIASKMAEIRVIETSSDWFGVTYPDDKEKVQGKIQKLTATGIYPAEGLWNF